VSAWRKAKALLAVGYAYMLAYRAELVLWALANSLPFILMGVWTKAAASGSFPLTSVEMARYFLAVFVIRQLTVVWVIWEFEYAIVNGRLSSKLLRPIDPAWDYIATHVAERAARLPFSAAIIALFFALYPDALWTPALGDVALTLVIAALAFALRFLMQYTLAMLNFWVERASGVEQLWMLLYLFLSGLIAPLELFPEVVREVAMLTPFPYVVYFPVTVLLGGDVDVARGLVVMSAWTAVFFLVQRVLWRAGLRRYSSMGA
jgi:ABC-2 type transport system permease protein